MESVLNLLLSLPLGILAAALLLECFVLVKDRRELEPAVLWLLFMATGISSLAAGTGFLAKGAKSPPSQYFIAGMAAAALLAALAFYCKRKARNQGVLKLSDRWLEPKSNLPLMRPGQQLFILGFRTAIFFAIAAAIVGALQVSSLFGGKGMSGKMQLAETGKPVSEPTPNQETPAPAPDTTNPPAEPEPPAIAESTPPPTNPISTTEAKPPEPSPTPTPVPTPPAPEATPTTPEPTTPVVTPPPAAPPGAETRQVSKNSLFAQKIRPIFAKHCVSCHGSQKQKADLRLDTPDWIRKGRDGKPVLLAGKPDQSSLYTLTIKPMDDDDRMPPAKSGAGLTKSEQEALKKWIESGADMGDGVSTASTGEVTFATDELAAKLPKPDPSVVEALTKARVKIRPVSKNGHLLEVDMSNADLPPGAMMLDKLASIGVNVSKLDLSRTRVADADLAHLAKMPNLHALLLSRTEVTDVGLAHVASLHSLELLNLYQTGATDGCIAHLTGLKNLKKVYVWQSKITPAGVAQLKQAIPLLYVNNGE